MSEVWRNSDEGTFRRKARTRGRGECYSLRDRVSSDGCDFIERSRRRCSHCESLAGPRRVEFIRRCAIKRNYSRARARAANHDFNATVKPNAIFQSRQIASACNKCECTRAGKQKTRHNTIINKKLAQKSS